MAAKARKNEILLGSPQVKSTAHSSWPGLGASKQTLSINPAMKYKYN